MNSRLEIPKSIRQALIESSPFFAAIRERFSDRLNDVDALAYAVEGHLRRVPDLCAIDGFDVFHVAEETETTLRIVGAAHILPSSLRPLEASFRNTNGRIPYRVLLGCDDKRWHDLTSKKRWAAVYLYATEGGEPKWYWSKPLEGVLSR